ncbi:MAG TPA: hypothetical protein DF774_16295 [Rheinheimera sp.]|uniref:hypothetical protein n=1 Tax=Rheinheimera sp. TaxID=1869214 RepID=UPI000EED0204|nr:hypothetical protein [Rheinheimera sp.]HCU67310.1 hypothetical protein [Rheinheimera sp.]
MKSSKIIITTTFIFSLSSLLFFNKDGLACEAAPLLGFEEIETEIYVDATLSQIDRETLSVLVKNAKARVNNAFGEMISFPRYIVTKDSKYTALGFNSTGMARSALLRECVFIGPKGINVDVIAHETSHAELFHRANFYTKNFKIKPWLLEGSGTYVDYREPLLLSNISLDSLTVEHVKSLSDFSSSDTQAYQASRVAFEGVDPKKLYDGIEKLNQGESFDTVFGN